MAFAACVGVRGPGAGLVLCGRPGFGTAHPGGVTMIVHSPSEGSSS